MNVLDRQLRAIALAGPIEFTIDDLTAAGKIALDASHAPNARQNGIGSYVNRAARDGLIEFTGRIERSKAPRRKGGAIRVWRITPAGIEWARRLADDG